MVSPNTVLERCERAGIDFWTSAKASLDLKDELENSMAQKEINNKIYNSLKKYNEESAERFRNYHSIEVRTTDGDLQTFEKDKIVQSLLRETQVPRTVAKEIAEQVSEDVRRLELRNISSSLVREMVNAKLLEKRHIEEKRNYTRIGLPIYDTKRIIESKNLSSPAEVNREFSSRVTKEYTLTKALPRELSQEHLKGNLHIHNIGGFITSPISIENRLRPFFKNGLTIPGLIQTGPAKNPEVAASHAARILTTSEEYSSGGVALDSFNTYISPYLEGLNQKEIQQVAQTFLYELNQGRASQGTFFINLDVETPESLKEEKAVMGGEETGSTYGDYQEEARRFMDIFLQTYQKGDYKGNKFKWPEVCIKHRGDLEDLERFPRPCYFINGGLKERIAHGEVLGKNEKGVMQTISLNLPQYLSEEDKKFKEKVKEETKIAKEIMKTKKRGIERKKEKLLPFLEKKVNGERYIKTEELSYHISLLGLIKTAKKIAERRGTENTERELKKIIRRVKKEAEDDEIDIHLSQKPNRKALKRFRDSESDKSLQLTEENKDLMGSVQKHLNGGAFLENTDESLVEEENRFIKLV